MSQDDVIAYLRGLTAKQFAETFYVATEGQHPWPGEEKLHEVRYVLAYASRYRGEPEAAWEVMAVRPTPNDDWVDDAPVCQHGEHCGLQTISRAKHSVCPVCGGHVYGT